MKTKSWLFPDGTTCKNQNSDFDDTFYCINGRCEVRTNKKNRRFIGHHMFCSFHKQKFSCENSSTNMFNVDPIFCPQNLIFDDKSVGANSVLQENGRDFKSMNLENIDRRQDPYIMTSTVAVANFLLTTSTSTTTPYPTTMNSLSGSSPFPNLANLLKILCGEFNLR
jgi:hypothetical protein